MRRGVQGDGGIPLGGSPGAGRDPIILYYLSLDVNNIPVTYVGASYYLPVVLEKQLMLD